MASLEYLLKGMIKHNRDGSFSTQSDRFNILRLIAKELKEGGFRNMRPESLKPKHVQYLLAKWNSEGKSPGTQKNRMAAIRWWAEKVGKADMIPKSNNSSNGVLSLNIEKRIHVPLQSKGRELEQGKLAKLSSKHVELSLKLQREFGLRREEAIKFMPSFAIRSNVIALKASWTKGGRAREIPILTDSQRDVLNQVKAFVGQGSLIPNNKNYVQQLKVYENQTSQVGLDKNHGLRHRYAQDRYEVLAGWKCPIEGGISQKAMNIEQRKIDKEVRLQISHELGHGRVQITTAYLGS